MDLEIKEINCKLERLFSAATDYLLLLSPEDFKYEIDELDKLLVSQNAFDEFYRDCYEDLNHPCHRKVPEEISSLIDEFVLNPFPFIGFLPTNIVNSYRNFLGHLKLDRNISYHSGKFCEYFEKSYPSWKSLRDLRHG